MASEEHLRIIGQGVRIWNEWREKNPELIFDLRQAKLYKADLREADLREANLSKAELHSRRFGLCYETGQTR